MKEYFAMWKNGLDFSNRTSRRGYWLAFLITVIVTSVLELIGRLLPDLSFLVDVYTLAAFVPGLALTIRRLRDAGKKWQNIFFAFLPVVGTILLIVYLCTKSAEPTSKN